MTALGHFSTAFWNIFVASATAEREVWMPPTLSVKLAEYPEALNMPFLETPWQRTSFSP